MVIALTWKLKFGHTRIDFIIKTSMRILPHQQNTGGFFVAVLKKVKPLPWEAQVKEKAVVQESTETTDITTNDTAVPAKDNKDNGPRSPARKKRKIRGFKEDPYLFFDEKEELWPPIK